MMSDIPVGDERFPNKNECTALASCAFGIIKMALRINLQFFDIASCIAKKPVLY